MLKWRPGNIFSVEIVDKRQGFVVMKVSGKGAKECFDGEAGGHRWQRVPPTEKHGRTQTSTITVAILPEPKSQEVCIQQDEIKEIFTCGSGPGGQHRNKNATAVQITHLPTGIMVRAESEKSQVLNRENALSILRARLLQIKKAAYNKARTESRRKQVGFGLRSEKIRTIQVKNNTVIDHRTGKKITYKEYKKGKLDGLKK